MQGSPARNTRGSSEADASTIAGFIKRFRDDEPSSPEARSKQMKKIKIRFGGSRVKMSLRMELVRHLRGEAAKRQWLGLREKSQQQESGEVQMRK